jgi:hypothetical protein
VSRFFVSAVLAIGLLFAGSVAVIWWSTGDEGAGGPRSIAPLEQPTPPAAPAVVAAPPAPAPAVLENAAGAPRPVPASAPPPRTEPRRPGDGPALSTQGNTPAARRRALAAFRREIAAGLRTLDVAVVACGRAAAPGASSALGEASFTLAVEAVDGGVRIAGVDVEERGTASEAEMACAISTMQGYVIPASGAVPGSHWNLPYTPGTR